MDKNEWSYEEKELHKKFMKMYEDDETKPSRPLDTSFMDNKEKRPARRTWIMRTAAIVMLVVITSVTTAIFVSEDYASAVKDSLSRKLFEWKYGVSVSPDGEQLEENETAWKIDDMETVSKAKKIVPDLRIPAFVPEGYSFKTLRLSQYEGGAFMGEYEYKNGDALLFISYQSLSDSESASGLSSEDALTLKDRTISFWEDPIAETRGATVFLDGVAAQIQGNTADLTKEMLTKIAKGL